MEREETSAERGVAMSHPLLVVSQMSSSYRNPIFLLQASLVAGILSTELPMCRVVVTGILSPFIALSGV